VSQLLPLEMIRWKSVGRGEQLDTQTKDAQSVGDSFLKKVSKPRALPNNGCCVSLALFDTQRHSDSCSRSGKKKMPKIQKLRKFKLASQAASYDLPSNSETRAEESFGDNEGNQNEGENKKVVLSRGQRKRQEKRERVLTKMGIVPLKNMKTGVVKPKAPKQKPFQALLSELEATIVSESPAMIRPAAVTLKSNKIKKSVAIRESQRMKLVEQHPNFIADPLQAMRAHIEQMIALKMENKVQK
jgi:hypothetical protein